MCSVEAVCGAKRPHPPGDISNMVANAPANRYLSQLVVRLCAHSFYW